MAAAVCVRRRRDENRLLNSHVTPAKFPPAATAAALQASSVSVCMTPRNLQHFVSEPGVGIPARLATSFMLGMSFHLVPPLGALVGTRFQSAAVMASGSPPVIVASSPGAEVMVRPDCAAPSAQTLPLPSHPW